MNSRLKDKFQDKLLLFFLISCSSMCLCINWLSAASMSQMSLNRSLSSVRVQYFEMFNAFGNNNTFAKCWRYLIIYAYFF